MNLFLILGLILICVALWGLLTGKVIAGSRGFKSNYYTRADNPLLYYIFIVFYICVGVFITVQSF